MPRREGKDPKERSEEPFEADDLQFTQLVAEVGQAYLKETQRRIVMLTSDLALMNDALNNDAIRSWMTVRFVIETLTDKKEIDVMMATVPPESRFYNDRSVVAKFVARLKYWVTEEIILNKDSMMDAFKRLEEQLKDSRAFLENYNRAPSA